MSPTAQQSRRTAEEPARQRRRAAKAVAVERVCPRMGCGNKPGAGTDHPGVGRCKHCETLQGLLRQAMARNLKPTPVRPEFALLEFLAQAHGDFRYWTSRMMAYAAEGDDVAYGDMIRMREQTAKHAASIATAILNAGIAERQVRLAEGLATREASVIREFCDRIPGWTEEQRAAAPEALRAALLLVGPPAAEDSIEAEWTEDV